MKLFTKREYVKSEMVTFRAWVTYYPKFKNFVPGKAVVLHIPIPFYGKQYCIDTDELRSGWRIPVLILSWYPNRILLCYGNVMIADMKEKRNG